MSKLISVADANILATNYNTDPNAVKTSVNGKNLVSFAFEKQHINQILEQTDCDGLRLYLAADSETCTLTLVALGYNETQERVLNDILKDKNNKDAVVVDFATPCPSHCPEPVYGKSLLDTP